MINDRLEITVASGDTLDTRHFQVDERMSSPFEISLVAVSENPDIDFESVVGQPMSFRVRVGVLPHQERLWTGVCKQLRQVAVEDQGLSTYQLTLVPTLWFLTQRRNHRMFQLKSELEIVLQILGEWGIQPVQRITGEYKKRKYRVQYAESDFTFVSRMLEDAGISYYFETEGGETKLVLHDAPQSNVMRAPPIAFRDEPTDADKEHVTAMQIGRQVRPGKYTLRDHDYRRPASYKLLASAAGPSGIEEKLERYHYTPGAFLFESDAGESTPNADDKGKYRTDETEARAIAQRRLDAQRAAAKTVTFDVNVIDLAPGVVVSFLDHPKTDLGPGKRFLILSASLSGGHGGKWSASCEAVSAEQAFHPALDTPKPKVIGVESATVVGPAGEEIHTDEFGRVRVHFHWDRESKMNDGSSCWIHVSQPWGGTGFGGTNLPRVGQEVIVDFLGGDPDRPIIVGRVYTNLQKTPYKLPDNKTQSGWQSRSSPGGTGENFNEIMFEDKKGSELVRMQAEKDLHKLVKNDEDVKIGHDRMKKIGHDDGHHVGNDRTRTVGHDEAVSVGHDRARQVGNDEAIAIGNNRSKTVGSNEDSAIGANQTLTVGSNQTEQIGGDRQQQIGGSTSLDVGKAMTVKIALTKSETVGIATNEAIGIAKKLEIGQSYEVTVGQAMSVNVGQQSSVNVGDVWQLTVGASIIQVDKAGNVIITAKNVAVSSDGPVTVDASGAVKVQAGGAIKIQGSTVDVN